MQTRLSDHQFFVTYVYCNPSTCFVILSYNSYFEFGLPTVAFKIQLKSLSKFEKRVCNIHVLYTFKVGATISHYVRLIQAVAL